MSVRRTLYELAGLEDRRVCPFCWRVKMALAHKSLDFDVETITFSEKHKIAFSGQQQVPVLVDRDNTITDSWTIACYLEDTYPDTESLFAGEPTRALTRVFNHWFETLVTMTLFPLVQPDNFDVVHPEDMDYYVKSRYEWLGKTREELEAERSEGSFVAWRKSLEPLREQLRQQAYLGGETPLFADYIVFSTFMWARAVSPWPVILKDDVLYDWRERLLDRFDGLARRSTGYEY